MKALDRVKLLVVILLGTSASIFAQTPATQNQIENRFVKQIVYAMDHTVPMVVESSIFVSLQVKEKYPNESYNKIVDKLEDLAINGESMAVRYKAQLAAIYFHYFDFFKDVKADESKDPDATFKTIANKIENNTFAVN